MEKKLSYIPLPDFPHLLLVLPLVNSDVESGLCKVREGILDYSGQGESLRTRRFLGDSPRWLKCELVERQRKVDGGCPMRIVCVGRKNVKRDSVKQERI